MYGALSSLIVSPCCTPIALALGMQAAQHEPALAAATMLTFGAGHACSLAILAYAAGLPKLRKFAHGSSAGATVSGALLTAVGGLYAVLA